MTEAEAGRPVLGLSCGNPNGSAEILLKIALRAAESAGASVQLVRLDDLQLPSGPDPREPDDAGWYWEQLIEADGVIISSPIITRTVSARLKLLGDRLLGPNADAAIIERALAERHAGRDVQVPFAVDERVLKPRVAGFLSVGGSLTSQWKGLSLPVLHGMTFSMSMAVVDQVEFEGAGTPQAIVLDDEALVRAELLGRNVASQLGRSFEDAEYLGPPGLCPMCHLNAVLLTGTLVECATCGARGSLDDGAAVTWTDLTTSVISMTERRAHAVEIQETAARHASLRAEIDRRVAEFAAYDRLLTPPRS